MGRGELCFRTTSRLNQCFPPWAVTVGAVLRCPGRCLYLDLRDTGDHPLGELQALMVNVENLLLWAREEVCFQLSLPRQWHCGLTPYALWPDLLGVAPVPSGPPIQSGGLQGLSPRRGWELLGGGGWRRVAGLLGGECSGDSVRQVALGQLQQALPPEETLWAWWCVANSVHPSVRVPGLSGGYPTTGVTKAELTLWPLLDPFIGLALVGRKGRCYYHIHFYVHLWIHLSAFMEPGLGTQMNNIWSLLLRSSKGGGKSK